MLGCSSSVSPLHQPVKPQVSRPWSSPLLKLDVPKVCQSLKSESHHDLQLVGHRESRRHASLSGMADSVGEIWLASAHFRSYFFSHRKFVNDP
jgi:hypothetical protein